MDRSKQKEIASKGGKAAHQKGTAHEWTSEEARDAGRKGGLASHRRRREQRDAGDTQEMVGVVSGAHPPDLKPASGSDRQVRVVRYVGQDTEDG